MIKGPKRAEDYHASSENDYRQQKMEMGRKEKQHVTLHSEGWEEGGLGAAPRALWDQQHQYHPRACERCSLSAPCAGLLNQNLHLTEVIQTHSKV